MDYNSTRNELFAATDALDKAIDDLRAVGGEVVATHDDRTCGSRSLGTGPTTAEIIFEAASLRFIKARSEHQTNVDARVRCQTKVDARHSSGAKGKPGPILAW